MFNVVAGTVLFQRVSYHILAPLMIRRLGLPKREMVSSTIESETSHAVCLEKAHVTGQQVKLSISVIRKRLTRFFQAWRRRNPAPTVQRGQGLNQ